jgi:argininosuccinate lyase
VNASLQAMGLILNGIRVNVDGIASRLRGGFMGATEIADALARRGMPFRDAHDLVGRIVLYAQERGRELWELSPDEYRQFSPLLDADVVQATTPAGIVASKRSPGGTAPERVREQVQAVREAITDNLSWLAALPAAPVERDATTPGTPPNRRGSER